MARKAYVVMRYTSRGVFSGYGTYTPIKVFFDKKLAREFVSERNSNRRCRGTCSLISCELIDK